MHAIRSQLVVICLLAGLGMAQSAAAQSRLPERGLDKSTVETRLGSPQRVEGPVGEPPITRWVYADFIVVFEYDHVVHTVPRQPAVEQGSGSPAPSGQTTPDPAAEPATPADAQTSGDTLNIPQ